MTARTTVVVVNLDGGDDLLGCLESAASSGVPVDLVVVDNASRDGSAERVTSRLPEATVLRNDRNRGFAAAANQGVRASATPYLLLLNPDARVRAGAMAALERSLDSHPRAGAVGPLVRNPDGTVQPSKRAFPSLWQAALHGLAGLVWPSNPGTRAYTLADVTFAAAARVDWISASAIGLRRDAFLSVDGFDERFFFFVEDVDLCKRLSDAGWEIWFEPGAEVVHLWGGTWTRRPLRHLWMHQRNLLRYVRKHYRGRWVLAYPFIGLGLLLRFALLAARWLVVGRSVPAHRATEEVRT